VTTALDLAIVAGEISTPELSRRIGEPSLCVRRRSALVPVQRLEGPVAARGWPHPGAVSLPAAFSRGSTRDPRSCREHGNHRRPEGR